MYSVLIFLHFFIVIIKYNFINQYEIKVQYGYQKQHHLNLEIMNLSKLQFLSFKYTAILQQTKIDIIQYFEEFSVLIKNLIKYLDINFINYIDLESYLKNNNLYFNHVNVSNKYLIIRTKYFFVSLVNKQNFNLRV